MLRTRCGCARPCAPRRWRRSVFTSTLRGRRLSSSSSALPPVAILAGGLATRLRSVTSTIPKAMVSVAGEPFIAHQLRLLQSRGASRAVLCLGHLGKQVCDFVGDGRRFGVDVEYSFDGEALVGTGGALRKALPFLGDVFF